MTAVAVVLLEVLRVLTWAPQAPNPGQIVIRTQQQLTKTWIAHGGEPSEMPQVNFNEEMVIGVFSGERRTGGFGITIEKIVVKPDADEGNTIYVIYKETGPAKGDIVPQVLTYPSHAVVVKKTEGKVQFVTPDSREAEKVLKALK
jgi:hypothetical protein